MKRILVAGMVVSLALALGSARAEDEADEGGGGGLFGSGVQSGVDTLRGASDGTDNVVDDAAVDGVGDELGTRGLLERAGSGEDEVDAADDEMAADDEEMADAELAGDEEVAE